MTSARGVRHSKNVCAANRYRLTVLEYGDEGECRYLCANRGFLRELNALGISGLRESESLLASGQNRWGLNLKEGCASTKAAGEPRTLHFVTNGEMEIMTMTHLGSLGQKDAYEVVLQRADSSASSIGLNTTDPALVGLFSLYMAVMVIDPEADTVREVFRSRTSVEGGRLTGYFRQDLHDDGYRWYGFSTISTGVGETYTHCVRFLNVDLAHDIFGE